MSSLFRLAGIASKTFLRNEKFNVPILIRTASAKSSAKTIPADETFDQRNIRLKRPKSPSLSIYAPQLTALLSITQRATGIVLSSYAMGLAAAALFLPESIPEYIDKLECAQIGEIGMIALKMMLCSPICYHYCNGIRHLIWDTAMFLSIKEVYATGYIMLICALAATIVLSIL